MAVLPQPKEGGHTQCALTTRSTATPFVRRYALHVVRVIANVRPTNVRSMNIPCLGNVVKDEKFGSYYSQSLRLPLLNDKECRIVVEGYDDDERTDDFHVAIRNLLTCPFSVLKAAEEYVYTYYRDMNSHWELSDQEFILINSPSEVWDHVQFGTEPRVTRRAYGDRAIYVSIECNCDWEPEHGLQIVLKNGERVTKVGAYDGHLTNSNAYDDESLEHVVYR
jgi:uncharacterized protein DUF6985